MIGYGKTPYLLVSLRQCGSLVYKFSVVFVVFSTTFAHDSRLRCGVADLYYALYGRSRPPCLPLPEVCRKLLRFRRQLNLTLMFSK